jgi:carbamoylphosphate synthase large subunit
VPPVTAPEYIDILNDIIEKEKIDFLHSQPEQEVEFIARNKEKIHTKTMFPDINTINICQNKMLFNQLLKKKELYIPESYLINCEEDLRN